jgi:hypothetical protein
VEEKVKRMNNIVVVDVDMKIRSLENEDVIKSGDI